MPKVRIQITSYNNGDYITDAILSACKFKDKDLEIFIFDDGSTDNSPEIIKEIAKTDPRIIYELSEENRGEAVIRTEILEKCDSDYVLVLDGDDVLIPGDWLEADIAFLELNPDVGASYGKILLVDENLKRTGQVMGSPFSRFNFSFENPICHPGIILRRKAILDVGAYKESGTGKKTIATDRFLWYRLICKYDFHFDNSFRCFYRQHGKQQTQVYADKYKEADLFMKKYILENNKDFQTALFSGQPLNLTENDRRTALLLLGIALQCTDIKSPVQESIINAAEAIAPNDYGICFRRYSYFSQNRDFANALAQCDIMLEKFAHEAFLTMTACRLKLKILEQTGDLSQIDSIKSELQRAEKEYGYFGG